MPTELQDAIDTPIFVDIALPIEERRHQAHAVARLKEAARRVANRDTEPIARAIVDATGADHGDDDEAWVLAFTDAEDKATKALDAALGIPEAPHQLILHRLAPN